MSDPVRDEGTLGPRQMAFAFPTRPALDRADFLVAPCNAAAVAWIDRWPDWPGPALALVGPAGCGKTHLAHVLAARAGAVILDQPDVARLDEALVEGRVGPVVLELGPGMPSPDAAMQEALFHLLNLTAETGGHFLLTTAEAPARWPVSLPDLRSRLAAMPMAEITHPDETLIHMVLVKLFADRQVSVPPDVARYLSRHLERSFAAARDIVARLDRLALSRGRGITLALAREAINAARSEQTRDPPAE